MKNNKILKSKVEKNTILSVFDNIQDKPITLLQWIKKVYKNSRIERIEVQNSNEGNDFGFILVFYFLDGSRLQTPLIRVATQEVLEQLQEAINELQHDIDTHTSNKSNPHETTFTNLLDKPNLITRVEQIDNSLYLYYVGVDTPFIYTPNLAQGVAWGNITGLLADQTDLAEVLQSKLNAELSTLQLTAPTSAITDGGIHIVYLESEPSNKYDGYIYIIKE